MEWTLHFALDSMDLQPHSCIFHVLIVSHFMRWGHVSQPRWIPPPPFCLCRFITWRLNPVTLQLLTTDISDRSQCLFIAAVLISRTYMKPKVRPFYFPFLCFIAPPRRCQLRLQTGAAGPAQTLGSPSKHNTVHHTVPLFALLRLTWKENTGSECSEPCLRSLLSHVSGFSCCRCISRYVDKDSTYGAGWDLTVSFTSGWGQRSWASASLQV